MRTVTEDRPEVAQKKPAKISNFNFIFDILMFIGYATVVPLGFYTADFEPGRGPLIHEWAAMVLIMVFICHLELHYKWFSGALKKKTVRRVKGVKIKLIAVLALIFTFITTFISGLMISQSFGLAGSALQIYRDIHHLAAKISIGVVLFHIVLHARWIYDKVKRRK